MEYGSRRQTFEMAAFDGVPLHYGEPGVGNEYCRAGKIIQAVGRRRREDGPHPRWRSNQNPATPKELREEVSITGPSVALRSLMNFRESKYKECSTAFNRSMGSRYTVERST